MNRGEQKLGVPYLKKTEKGEIVTLWRNSGQETDYGSAGEEFLDNSNSKQKTMERHDSV